MNFDNVTNGTAVAAVTSKLWLPSFHSISAACAEWVPILGAGWLALRIGCFLWDRYRGR